MIHLEGVSIQATTGRRGAGFPFSVPAIAALAGGELCFPSAVTILVGENGSGKSTFLESLACAIRLPAIGASDTQADPTLAHGRELAKAMRLRWRLKRPNRGFFLRAEDFFGFSRRIDAMRTDLEADLRAVQTDPELSETARAFGSVPFASEIDALRSRYGDGLETRSHGEQFLDLFQARCVSGGIYLLDEPEAPLSPARQLSLISLILRMTREEESQFILATHSPMLMALPEATIYSFDEGTVHPAEYETLEHVTIMRTFLDDPEAYLRHL